LTTYTYHLELKVITTLSLISTLQISREPAKPSAAYCAFASRSLATASNSGDSSASRAQALPVQRISRNLTLSVTNSTVAPSLSLPRRAQLNWIAPIVFFITPRRGPRRKHRSSIVACMFFSVGTCLPSRCSETAVYLFVYCIATAVLVCFEVFA
jgi:hypothetical protein